ncbi:hypothetical protein ACHQM5_029446 [Ranunculus cassubicifolius]
MVTFLSNFFIKNRNLSLNPSLIIRFISTDSTTHHQNSSFTISYLINSCGLTPKTAISTSKIIQFQSSTNPDSVLTLLRNNGFSNSYISKITAACPRLLLSKVDKTLKPKFDFFLSKGLAGPDLAKVLCRDPLVLLSSVEKSLIPSFDFLTSVVRDDEKLIAMLKRSTQALRMDLEKMIAPKLAILRANGLDDNNIVKLLVTQPRVFLINVPRFGEIVEEVKKMGFDSSQYAFLAAIHGLACMSRSSVEAKFDVYRSWGWSEDELQCAFRKDPYCMMLSRETIMSKMNCFVNEFGYAPSLIAKRPGALHYSLEGRIIPRCTAIQALVKNGLLKKKSCLSTFLAIPENKFWKEYIPRFQKDVPQLLTAIQAKASTQDELA